MKRSVILVFLLCGVLAATGCSAQSGSGAPGSSMESSAPSQGESSPVSGVPESSSGTEGQVSSGEEGGGAPAIAGREELIAALEGDLGVTLVETQYDGPFTCKGYRPEDIRELPLSLYCYDSLEECEKVASSISGDGFAVGNTQVEWVGAPHFYRFQDTIVGYFGEDETILSQLEALLGEPFEEYSSEPLSKRGE